MREARVQGLWRGLVLLTLLSGLLGAPHPAYSQAAVSLLRITSVDTSAFPEVKVRFWAEGANGTPLPALLPEDLVVREDSAQITPASLAAYEAGFELAIVVEAGTALGRPPAVGAGTPPPTANRHTDFSDLWDTVLGQIEPFLSGGGAGLRDGVDHMSVIVQQFGEAPTLLVSTRSQPDALTAVLNHRPSTSDSPTSLFGAVDLALDQLESLRSDPAEAQRPQAVLVFSSGNRENMGDLVNRAKALQIPIYPVFMLPEENFFHDQGLIALAGSVTGGTLIRESDEDWTARVQAILASLVARRNQYELTYRSTSGSAAERLISVQAGSARDEIGYAVQLAAPLVTISSPTANRLFNRIANAQNNANPASVSPAEHTVVAEISWPNGGERNLRQLDFLVDSARLTSIDLSIQANPASTSIVWDLSSYTNQVTDTLSLEVVVIDELGLEYRSDPVPVLVVYRPYVPPATATTVIVEVTPSPTPCPLADGPLNVLCPVMERLPGTVPYASLAIALASLVFAGFVYFNRGKIAPAAQAAFAGVGEFVDRLTHRVGTSTPKAYLIALEGLDTGRKSFEIFGETRLGRSPKFADLSFQANQESSPLSRLQCTILNEDDAFFLRDEGSANGTYLNGIRLREGDPGRETLHDGDEIELGQVERGGIRFRFELAKEGGSDDTSRITQPQGGLN